MVINVELVTEVQGLLRRDHPMTDRTLLNPNNANPLLDGEFVNFDSAYGLIRGAAGSFGFMVYTERGRFDVQALGKVTILQGGAYEANTRIFTAAALALGSPVKISDSVTIDSVTKSGLVNQGGSGTIIGYVTRMPANNGNLLRFQQTLV